jgi:rhodanese-related sulfurtransferase
VVLDVRSETEWDEWHHPGSIHRESWELISNPAVLDRRKTYVAHCEQGVQSTQVAEVLQRAGYEVYALRGGTAALRRQAESGRFSLSGEREAPGG